MPQGPPDHRVSQRANGGLLWKPVVVGQLHIRWSGATASVHCRHDVAPNAHKDMAPMRGPTGAGDFLLHSFHAQRCCQKESSGRYRGENLRPMGLQPPAHVLPRRAGVRSVTGGSMPIGIHDCQLPVINRTTPRRQWRVLLSQAKKCYIGWSPSGSSPDPDGDPYIGYRYVVFPTLKPSTPNSLSIAL